MHKTIVNASVWLLFLGGLVGFLMALLRLFGGGTPVEYGVLGIGGGMWLLFSTIAASIHAKL